jgi:hypothetical protein
MKLSVKLFYAITCIALFLYSCEEDNETPQTPIDLGYTKGVFISCEGNWSSINGSISYFSPDPSYILNDIFGVINGTSTGDVVQSFAFAGSKGVIVANNSAKVKFVNLIDFKQTGEIYSSYPRYFLAIDSTKGYLTDGSLDGKVYTINLQTYEKTDSVSVGKGPEHMGLYSGNLYVANSGGWGLDSTISVINTTTGNKEYDFYAYAHNPTDLVIVESNKCFIICNGYTDYVDDSKSTPAKLIVTSITGETMTKSYTLPTTSMYSPYRMASSPAKDYIYYSNSSGIFRIDAKNLPDNTPTEPFITLESIYGLGVNPVNGDIYCLISTSFTTNGIAKVYGSDGAFKFEFNVGISPNGVTFNL